MSPYAGAPTYEHRTSESSSAGLKILALFLGIALGVLILLAFLDVDHDAGRAERRPPGGLTRGRAAVAVGSVASPSFAGIAPGKRGRPRPRPIRPTRQSFRRRRQGRSRTSTCASATA